MPLLDKTLDTFFRIFGEKESPETPEIRDAGPECMTDPPPEWDQTDEEVDESFPASDPPGNY